jgi:predicted nucleic acid-binding protein
VESLLELLPVLPFGIREARRHAELWAELAVQGRLIGPHDMIIAATALAGGHGLATLNRAELSRVPGLRLIPL